MSTKIDPLIAFAIPTWGKVSVRWAQAFRHLGGPLGSNMVELAPVVGQPIAAARNELMQSAINNNCDFIFFLGDDVLPEGDAIIKLLSRMWDNPEIDMITGVYWTKSWPTAPYIWRGIQRGPYLEWKLGELFQIDFAGCDCLLIRLTPEMKALGPDWFSTDWQWNEGAPSLLATEDFYFYTKARKAGLKLWCDTAVQCIHEDRGTGIQYGLTTDMPQFVGAANPPLPEPLTDDAPFVKVADIGAGYDEPYFGDYEHVKVYRFDGDESTKPDYRCDMRHLPVEDQSFDVVHSRHVLEHFGRKECVALVKEWARILRVGGEFRLCMPNAIDAMQKVILMDEGIVPLDRYPWWQVYGQQEGPYDFHRNGFSVNKLRALMEAMGFFEDIVVTRGGAHPDDGETINVYATARKSKHPENYAILPDWDAIEEAEKVLVAGLRHETEEAPAAPEPEPELVATPHLNGSLASFSSRPDLLPRDED